MNEEIIDPLLQIPVIVKAIQPYQALKKYECPGCNHEIAPKTGHIVAVPIDDPDLRKHWHRPCWEREISKKQKTKKQRKPK